MVFGFFVCWICWICWLSETRTRGSGHITKKKTTKSFVWVRSIDLNFERSKNKQRRKLMTLTHCTTTTKRSTAGIHYTHSTICWHYMCHLQRRRRKFHIWIILMKQTCNIFKIEMRFKNKLPPLQNDDYRHRSISTKLTIGGYGIFML